MKEETKEERSGVLRGGRPVSPKRSRSPLRRVSFSPSARGGSPTKDEKEKQGMMRMQEAKDAVPRQKDESRADWKKRVFEHKKAGTRAFGYFICIWCFHLLMMRDLLTGLKLNDTDHSRHSATKSCLRNGMALTDLEDCYGAIFFYHC